MFLTRRSKLKLTNWNLVGPTNDMFVILPTRGFQYGKLFVYPAIHYNKHNRVSLNVLVLFNKAFIFFSAPSWLLDCYPGTVRSFHLFILQAIYFTAPCFSIYDILEKQLIILAQCRWRLMYVTSFLSTKQQIYCMKHFLLTETRQPWTIWQQFVRKCWGSYRWMTHHDKKKLWIGGRGRGDELIGRGRGSLVFPYSWRYFGQSCCRRYSSVEIKFSIR